ncbi:MAG: GAF domain-containing protein [Anaerolineae bacterium]|nr:GAF domain-containing protein [Anaerolineae bacterium]
MTEIKSLVISDSEFVAALSDIAAALNSALNLDELLECILANVGRVVPHDTADIMLLDDDTIYVAGNRGYLERGQASILGLRFSLAEIPNLHKIAQTGQPLIIADTHLYPDWVDIPSTRWIRSYVGTPIRLRNQVVGFLNLTSSQPGFYAHADAQRLQAFADQAGIAIGNTRLLEAEREQRELAEALREVGATLSATLDFDLVLDRLLDQVAHIAPYDTGNVFLVEQGVARVVRTRGHEKLGADLAKATAFLSFELAATPNLRRMAESKEPLVIPDTSTDPTWIKGAEWAHVRSWVGAPIVAQGQVIAFFSLDKIEPNFYQAKHAKHMAVFASQAALALENARLFAAEASRRREAETLREAAAALTSALDLEQVLDNILTHLEQVIPYHSACVFLLEGDHLRAVAGRGLASPDLIHQIIPLATNDPFVEKLQRTQRPICLPDAQAEPHFKRWGNTDYVRGWMAIPLLVRGQFIGYVTLDSRRVDAYNETQADLAQAFANQAAMAIENARLYTETRRRLEEQKALREAGAIISSSLELETVLKRIAEQMGKIVNATSVYICGLDPKTMISTLLAEYFGPAAQVQEAVSELGFTYDLPHEFPEMSAALQAGQSSLFHLSDPDLSEVMQSYMRQQGVQTILDIPLQIGGQTIAYAELWDSRQRDFTADEIALCQDIAQRAAVAIQNVQLYEQAQRYAAELELRVAERTFELEVLYQLTQALGEATQLNDIIRLILIHLYQAIPHDVAASLLVNNSNGALVIQSQRPLDRQVEANIQEIMEVVLNRPLAHAVEVRRIQSRVESPPHLPLQDLASIMQVPIVIDETPVGLLFVGAEQPNQFNLEQVRLLRTIANQAAESIQRLQRLLAAEYQRLESLVAHLPDGIVLLDAERRIALINPAAQKFLNALTPVSMGDQLIYLGDQTIEAMIAPPALGLPQEIETTSYPRRIFEIITMPVAAGPEAGGWALVIRDVTTERAIQERTQQQDRLVAVGQLAAGIAHDFNNILTSMIGFVELARIHPELPPIIDEDLRRVIQQGQRAAALIRQILDFSRQSITEKRPLEFSSFLKETIKLLERTISEDIRITLEIEPASYEAYTLNADPTQIQQVLTNLAVNARDAMPMGGTLYFRLSPIKVEADERPPYPEMSPGYWLALSISDTGTGISDEALPRIFEPFFTTKGVGRGTGLGLAQVYGIITQHEGYIDVQTELGQGATFTLYLPVSLPSSQSLSPLTETDTTPGHGELILLVEDNLVVLEVTEAMLKHLGYQVITATNGRQALDLYDQYQEKIALVLTDVTMPEMGGIALAQNLQAKYPAVKVIALTGYPLEAETKDLLDQGIVDWLQKPLNRRQLAQTISQSLKTETKSVFRREDD